MKTHDIKQKITLQYIPLITKYVEFNLDLKEFDREFCNQYSSDPFIYEENFDSYPQDIDDILASVFSDLDATGNNPEIHPDLYVSEYEFRILCTKNLAKLQALVDEM